LFLIERLQLRNAFDRNDAETVELILPDVAHDREEQVSIVSDQGELEFQMRT